MKEVLRRSLVVDEDGGQVLAGNVQHQRAGLQQGFIHDRVIERALSDLDEGRKQGNGHLNPQTDRGRAG